MTDKYENLVGQNLPLPRDGWLELSARLETKTSSKTPEMKWAAVLTAWVAAITLSLVLFPDRGSVDEEVLSELNAMLFSDGQPKATYLDGEGNPGAEIGLEIKEDTIWLAITTEAGKRP